LGKHYFVVDQIFCKAHFEQEMKKTGYHTETSERKPGLSVQRNYMEISSDPLHSVKEDLLARSPILRGNRKVRLDAPMCSK
jgi:hypothetical protein